LWIIAFSLLTIAICLVALVLRSFTGRDPEAVIAATESPVHETPPRDRLVRIASPARAASAPTEVTDSATPQPLVESSTQTVVQTSQTIAITPPVRGLALGARKAEEADSSMRQGLVGTVIGQVTLQGEPPPEKKYDVPVSAGCDHLREHPPTTHNYEVGTNRGLANAFIRLIPMPAPGPGGAGVTNTVALTFTNCDLQPYLIAVTPKDRLVFRNLSPMKHVLEFVSREGLAPFATVPLNAGSEISQSAMRILSGDQMRIISVRCALHEWEQSRIASSSEPRFAITDMEGRFAISNVLPYAYAVELYHQPTFGMSRQYRDIILHAGATQSVTFRIYPKH